MNEILKCEECGVELIDNENCCYQDGICDNCYEDQQEEEGDDE